MRHVPLAPATRAGLFVLSVLYLLSPSAALAVSTEGDPAMVARANAWKPGEPVPAALLEHRSTPGDQGLVTDSVAVYGSVANYPLLLEILFRQGVAARIQELAARRALDLGGPTRFFRDVGERLTRLPQGSASEVHEGLRQRSSWRHVAVDGLAIRDGVMKAEERRKELEAIARELKSGEPFSTVRERHAKGGRVGWLGDFIATREGADARPFRLARLPTKQVVALLAAKQGDIVTLRDDGQLEEVLFQVREVYPGDPAREPPPALPDDEPPPVFQQVALKGPSGTPAVEVLVYGVLVTVARKDLLERTASAGDKVRAWLDAAPKGPCRVDRLPSETAVVVRDAVASLLLAGRGSARKAFAGANLLHLAVKKVCDEGAPGAGCKHPGRELYVPGEEVPFLVLDGE